MPQPAGLVIQLAEKPFVATSKKRRDVLKSSNNTTDYDDKLFFQVATESLKKLFICPAKQPYTLYQPLDKGDEDGLQLFTFCRDKVEPVYCMADGKIVQVSSDGKNGQVYIEHENGLQTWFMADFVYGDPKVGVTLKQGDIIGHCKDFSCGIFVSPKTLFGE